MLHCFSCVRNPEGKEDRCWKVGGKCSHGKKNKDKETITEKGCKNNTRNKAVQMPR